MELAFDKDDPIIEYLSVIAKMEIAFEIDDPIIEYRNRITKMKVAIETDDPTSEYLEMSENEIDDERKIDRERGSEIERIETEPMPLIASASPPATSLNLLTDPDGPPLISSPSPYHTRLVTSQSNVVTESRESKAMRAPNADEAQIIHRLHAWIDQMNPRDLVLMMDLQRLSTTGPESDLRDRMLRHEIRSRVHSDLARWNEMEDRRQIESPLTWPVMITEPVVEELVDATPTHARRPLPTMTLVPSSADNPYPHANSRTPTPLYHAPQEKDNDDANIGVRNVQYTHTNHEHIQRHDEYTHKSEHSLSNEYASQVRNNLDNEDTQQREDSLCSDRIQRNRHRVYKNYTQRHELMLRTRRMQRNENAVRDNHTQLNEHGLANDYMRLADQDQNDNQTQHETHTSDNTSVHTGVHALHDSRTLENVHMLHNTHTQNNAYTQHNNYTRYSPPSTPPPPLSTNDPSPLTVKAPLQESQPLRSPSPLTSYGHKQFPNPYGIHSQMNYGENCNGNEKHGTFGCSDSNENCYKYTNHSYHDHHDVEMLFEGAEGRTDRFSERISIEMETSTPDPSRDENNGASVTEECSICLISHSGTRDLLRDDEAKMKSFTSARTSPREGLPRRICSICADKLESAYEFKLQVERANSVLRERCDAIGGEVVDAKLDRDAAGSIREMPGNDHHKSTLVTEVQENGTSQARRGTQLTPPLSLLPLRSPRHTPSKSQRNPKPSLRISPSNRHNPFPHSNSHSSSHYAYKKIPSLLEIPTPIPSLMDLYIPNPFTSSPDTAVSVSPGSSYTSSRSLPSRCFAASSKSRQFSPRDLLLNPRPRMPRHSGTPTVVVGRQLRGGGACWRCGHDDHTHRECRAPKQWAYCYLCGERNVRISNCPQCSVAWWKAHQGQKSRKTVQALRQSSELQECRREKRHLECRQESVWHGSRRYSRSKGSRQDSGLDRKANSHTQYREVPEPLRYPLPRRNVAEMNVKRRD